MIIYTQYTTNRNTCTLTLSPLRFCESLDWISKPAVGLRFRWRLFFFKGTFWATKNLRRRHEANRIFSMFFPTCQVRVVRFYVSLDLLLVLLRLLLLLRLVLSLLLRWCSVSVPRRTSTAILRGQCSAPDLNRDPVRPVFRAGHQPRSCEASVRRRTSTAILWGQCSAPDLNSDPVCSVFRAGPQPRSCEASVPRRTSAAKCVRKKNVRKTVRSFVRKNVRQNAEDLSERMSERMSDSCCKRYARKNLRLMSIRCPKECQNMRKYVCQKVWGSLEESKGNWKQCWK